MTRLFAGLAAMALLSVGLLVLYGSVTSQLNRIADDAIENSQSAVEQAKRDSADQVHTTEIDRMNSEQGHDLLRRCDEFTEFHENHPGDYASEQRNKACEHYETFVKTGRVR